MDISRSEGSVSVCRPEKAVRATEKQTSANTAHNHIATAAEIFMHGYYKRKRPARFRMLGVEPSRRKHAMEEDSSNLGYCGGPSQA
jgi:hypothetical protein